MPKIQIHDQQIGIQDVPASPEQDQNITPKIADTSALGEALYKTGAATSDFANTLIKSKVLADTAAAKSEFASAMTEHLAAGKQITDPEEIEKHKQVTTEIRNGIAERYPLAANMGPYLDHGVRVANTQLDNHGVALVVDDIRGKNLAEVARLNKEIAFAATPEEAENRRIERDVFLDNIADVGAEHRTTTERLKEEGNIKAELYRYDELIRTDPAAAKQMLLERNEDGTPVNVKYMGADLYGKLINEADQRERFNKNEFYTVQHRKQDENRQTLWTMIDEGKSDIDIISAIDRSMQQDQNGMIGLPSHEGFNLKEKIRNGSLKDVKTDYRTWDSLFTRIESGENVQADIGAAVASGRLSVPNAMALRSLVDRRLSGIDKQTDIDLKETLRTFKDKLTGIKEDLGGTSAEQSAAISAVHADATMAADFVKGQKDLTWFREYLDRSLESAKTNMSKDYRDKLSARNNAWYDKFMGEQGKTRRIGNIEKAPGAQSTGGPGQYDSIIDRVFGADAPTAKAIQRAENAPGDPTKVNPAGGGVGAIGLFQIRGKLHEQALKDAGIIKTTEDLKDPEINIRAAKFLYDRDGWTPWNESKANWGKTTGVVSTGGKYRRIS